MAPFKNFSILTLCVTITLSLSILLASAAPHVPPETACGSTVDPPYCKHLLVYQNGTIFDYCRFCVRKSLSQSRKFLSLIRKNLQNTSSLSQPTISALEDCKFLAQQNFDYLFNTRETVDNTTTTDYLPTYRTEDMQTLLSAVITNQQTCLEGLSNTDSDQRLKDDILSTLSNHTKLHSVSLALFVKGWVSNKKKTTSEAEIGRKLLQTLDGGVQVNNRVVVSKDGSGNFTTINDAINAAPNNTVAGSGYFQIFITEGVYEEYVSIPKNKKYLMMVGDGINRTIITGDHNVVDGFTTFNSATFGKQITLYLERDSV